MPLFRGITNSIENDGVGKPCLDLFHNVNKRVRTLRGLSNHTKLIKEGEILNLFHAADYEPIAVCIPEKTINLRVFPVADNYNRVVR